MAVFVGGEEDATDDERECGRTPQSGQINRKWSCESCVAIPLLMEPGLKLGSAVNWTSLKF